MVAAFGSGVAFSLVSGMATGANPLQGAFTTGVFFALFQGAFHKARASLTLPYVAAASVIGHAPLTLASTVRRCRASSTEPRWQPHTLAQSCSCTLARATRVCTGDVMLRCTNTRRSAMGVLGPRRSWASASAAEGRSRLSMRAGTTCCARSACRQGPDATLHCLHSRSGALETSGRHYHDGTLACMRRQGACRAVMRGTLTGTPAP